MARRDRFRGLVWLKRLPRDPTDGSHLVVSSVACSMHQRIAQLTGMYGLWCEIEEAGGFYTLRCYPRHPEARDGLPKVCGSWKGTRLAGLFTCAVADYEEYQASPSAAILGPLEVYRWVA